MTFQNDDGEELEVSGAVQITKQAVSFFSSKIKGDYSVNFSIDNNSVNRAVLGYNGPMMLNQVAFTRQSFTLMRNGNPFMKGYIVIQSDLGDTLSCFFISGNANWFNLLTGLITELDYSGVTNVTSYEYQLNDTNVKALRNVTSGVIFPMVDWCYNLNKGNNSWYVADLKDITNEQFTTYTEWYPCFFLHTLVSEICKQNGLKIGGNILNDSLYKSLVIPPFNGQMKREDVKITTAYGTTQSDLTGSFVLYSNITEGSDPEGLFANAIYTANKSSKVILTMTVTFVDGAGTVPTGQIRLRKNSTTLLTHNVAINGPLGTFVVETSAVSGDTFSIQFRCILVGGGLSTRIDIAANFKIDIPTTITVGDYIRPDRFLPALSCLDIIRFVVNYFGCAATYDEYSKTITANIVEKLDPADAQDWSEYFVSNKSDYVTVAAKNNYMKVVPSQDTELKAYDKSHLIKFGEGNITTANTLKEANDLLSIPFGASEFGISKNGDWLSNIPLVKLADSGNPVIYTSITDDGSGNAVYNFSEEFVFVAGQAVRIVDDTNGDIGIHIVSAFTNGPPDLVEFFGISFSATGTGKLYAQARVYNQVSPRLLVVNPGGTLADVSSVDQEYSLYPSTLTGPSAETSAPAALYTKPATGLNIDTFKGNVAFDNPDIDIYTDPAVRQVYFPRISKMIGNPVIPAVFKLPEAVFQSFDFQSFIYLKTKDLTGYFWVDSIINYQDGQTDVDVNLLML